MDAKGTPTPVIRALRKLGRDIRDARRRRRLPVAILAQCASISRTTLSKIEKGDGGVSFGTYATVLFIMGMADQLWAWPIDWQTWPTTDTMLLGSSLKRNTCPSESGFRADQSPRNQMAQVRSNG